MDRHIKKLYRRSRIKKGIRKKITGTSAKPRLSVYRSNTSIYAQIIDDTQGITLASASTLQINKDEKRTPVEQAVLVGQMVAQKAIENNVSEVVFDRSGYLYHGRIKALAEGARQGGLKF